MAEFLREENNATIEKFLFDKMQGILVLFSNINSFDIFSIYDNSDKIIFYSDKLGVLFVTGSIQESETQAVYNYSIKAKKNELNLQIIASISEGEQEIVKKDISIPFQSKFPSLLVRQIVVEIGDALYSKNTDLISEDIVREAKEVGEKIVMENEKTHDICLFPAKYYLKDTDIPIYSFIVAPIGRREFPLPWNYFNLFCYDTYPDEVSIADSLIITKNSFKFCNIHHNQSLEADEVEFTPNYLSVRIDEEITITPFSLPEYYEIKKRLESHLLTSFEFEHERDNIRGII